MNARRFAVVAALTLVLSGLTGPAHAGWDDPVTGPHGVATSADLEFAMEISVTSLAVVRAAL